MNRASHHADKVSEASSGAPYGASTRVRGAPTGGESPCGRNQWGLRRSSLWNGESCDACVELDPS
eukprot:6895947-Pyramimonas_sp.AAC.1